MRKLISFLIIFNLLFGMVVFAEGFKNVEMEYSNIDMNLRSDLTGKFSNNEDGAEKSGGIRGSFIEGKIDIKTPGVYHFHADMILKSSGGIVQMSVNGKDVGERVDTVAAKKAEKRVDFGSVYIENTGEIVVRFTAKETSGGGYDIGIKRLILNKEAVQISGFCEKVGNNFVEGEEVKFFISLKNMTSNYLNMSFNAEAESSYGTKVVNEALALELAPNAAEERAITLDITEKNTYTLRIILKIPSEKEEIVYELPFTYIEKVKDYEGESIFGTCTHITGVKFGEERTESMMTMLKNSGIHYIRDEYYWDHVELEKGKYTFYADDYVNALNEIGIKPMIVLSYANKYYGVPHNEEGYEAFGNYAAAVAEHLKGKVYGFEIWNEWNGGTWNGGYGNEEYVNIVKATYSKLKAVDPELQVACGAAITAPASWFDKLFELGAFDYCDVISYHPYCMPDNPDQKTYRGNLEDNFERMYKVMEKYGDAKKQWLTEWGWYTGTASSSVDEKTQAAFLMRGYINGMAYGMDKIFMYDFKDDGINESNSEHNYGIIHSWNEEENVKYAPKLGYVATAAMTNRLSGAKFVEEYRPLPDARVYKFENNGREIVTMYYMRENKSDIRSTKISLTGETSKMSAFDILGNPIDKVEELNASIIYLEGEKGQFNINDLIIKERNSALITFGEYKNSDGIYVDEHHDFDKRQEQNCFTIGKDMRFDEILCSVDDSYIYGGINAIAMEVSYLDDGTASFYVEYSAEDGSVKRTNAVKLTNTGNWKKEKLYINDAGFVNSLDGKDFRLVLENSEENMVSFMGVRITRAADEDKREMKIFFDNDADFENFENYKGINYSIKGDGMQVFLSSEMKGFSYAEKGGRKCVYVNAQGEALYIYVDADDDILYGNFDPVKVSVEYFDEGHGTFTLGYDVGNYTSFREAQIITLNDTMEWKTAEFTLTDCWWKNYANFLTDFRISLWAPTMGRSPEGVAFGGVSIEVLDGVEKKEIKDSSFIDIKGHWSESVICTMAEKGIISGYEDGTIKPDEKIKANEFIALLVQKMKYSDIQTGSSWDDGFINKAFELGIVKEGEFDSFAKEITRGEMARIISRITGAYNETDILEINDFETVPDELKGYVAGVYQNGIMIGDNDGRFYPERSATRAEAAVILSKI